MKKRVRNAIYYLIPLLCVGFSAPSLLGPASLFVSSASSSVASTSKTKCSAIQRKPWGAFESAFVRSPSFTDEVGGIESEVRMEDEGDIDVNQELSPLAMSESSRRLIIMGGPASGKGTQCEWISRRYNIVHLSTGDLLRNAVAKDASPGSIGALAKMYMDNGKLVPDDVIIHILKERIVQPDCQERGYLLDGFPRTRAQATALIEMGIRPDTFIFIDVPDEVLIERVVGRRMDPVDGKIYHLTFKPPPEEIKGRLITRSDDNEENAWKRLRQFHENVSSVKECFQDIMVQVDGASSPDSVAESIKILLERKGPTSRIA
eukprot:CAMPEP_0197433808 /NCGR_PEP_ID=MMETSP1175-20131217/1608_1 /TAXON_ID=1003142 /ORGANISM="Triceratium dubium, Strain CCMP147" /LENGTH=318 /DNA_ID=CAMNT_0042962299 /DNA_START=132 /DNA_END=1088 /DNA_ORIENTATION=+